MVLNVGSKISDIQIRLEFGKANSLNTHIRPNFPPPHTPQIFNLRYALIQFTKRNMSVKYIKRKCIAEKGLSRVIIEWIIKKLV